MNNWSDHFRPNAGILASGEPADQVNWLPLCREFLEILTMGGGYKADPPRNRAVAARWDEAKARALSNDRRRDYCAAVSGGFEVKLVTTDDEETVEDHLLSTVKRLCLQNPLASFQQFGKIQVPGEASALFSVKLRQNNTGHKFTLLPAQTRDGFVVRVEQDHDWRI